MADELNTPGHRWYQRRYNIPLANEDFSKQWIFDSGIQKIDAYIALLGGGAFSPAQLFASGEEGAWYEPSTTTCFTDTGGTVAATYGDGVAYLQDLSGNGHHATQVTAGARPILARVPEGGRRNLLEKTEQFDDAYWLANSGGTGTNPVLTSGQSDPNGGTGAWRIQFNKGAGTTSSDFSLLGRSVIPDAVGNNIFSFYAKSNTGVSQNLMAYCTPNLTPTVDTFTVTDVWQRFDLTYTGDGSLASLRIGARGSVTYGGDNTLDVLIYAPQLETGSTATAYQKVVDEHDITEAGVTSLEYLSFDGADDFLQNTSLTHNSTMHLSVSAYVETSIYGRDAIFYFGTGSGAYEYGLYQFKDATNARGFNTWANDLTGSTPATLDAAFVDSLEFNNGVPLSAGNSYFRNGTEQTLSVITGTPASRTMVSGFRIAQGGLAISGQNLTGRIYGIVLINRAKTTSERQNTEAYLAAKSGVTL